MKKILIDILFGVLTIILVTIFEFLVTLPFGEAGESFMNQEFLLTALLACFTTFILTWLLKTKSKSDSLRRAIIWTIMLALFYILIGIGNDNLTTIFTTIGIYILLLCAFVGPYIYSELKHLN